MKKPFLPQRRLVVTALFAAAATWATWSYAQTTPQPVVVVDSTGFDFYSTYQVSAAEWRGPAFTTGAITTQITEVTLGLANTDPATQASLQLYLLDDATELPVGAALASTTLSIVVTDDSANLNPNTYQAAQLGSIARTVLQPNKKYALIVSSPSGSAMGLSDYNGPGSTSYTFAGGFAIAADGYLHTSDRGTNWEKDRFVTPGFRLTVIPYEEHIEIDIPTTPTPVPTLGTLGLVGMASLMGVLGLRRTRKAA